MADPVSLEQRVAAVILEWDREHTESRAAEVIALCERHFRDAVAVEIMALYIPGAFGVGDETYNTAISDAAAVVGGPLEPERENG